MKKIINTFFVLSYLVIGLVCVSACTDRLDIQQIYKFDLETLPVQTTIVKGEEAEIRCQLVREGKYEETLYFIRYFQTSGKGQLRLDNGTILLPNDLYPLTKETFRLYYKSFSADSQEIDIYILDSFGQIIQKTFSFNNEDEDKEGI